MGVVLDTSVLVAAERRRLDIKGLLTHLGGVDVGIAAITAAELLHGYERAIGPHDYLIAATALSVGFAVASLNRGEFERVPGLTLTDVTDFLSPPA